MEQKNEMEINGSKINLTNPYLGAFLGAFASEGNLSNLYSVKVTNSNIKFLTYTIDCITRVIGRDAITSLPPTPEHKNGPEGYHKYFRSIVGKLLINGYEIKAGKKILSNQGLPNLINKNSKKIWVREWIRGYLQMRYSGDGHVRNNISGTKRMVRTRSIILTRDNALKIDTELYKKLSKLYVKGKKVKEYPKKLVDELKGSARNISNYPKEFIDLKRLLNNLFEISSRLECHGIRSIYKDIKISEIIVTGFYRLVISRKENIEKFYREINFAPFDISNREKLRELLSSYN